MSDSESSVEKHLNKRVEQLGGATRKYVSPGRAGVADRICFFPNGGLFFVEVKAEGGMETSAQCRERIRMQELGQSAIIVHGKNGVNQWIDHFIKFGMMGFSEINSQ